MFQLFILTFKHPVRCVRILIVLLVQTKPDSLVHLSLKGTDCVSLQASGLKFTELWLWSSVAGRPTKRIHRVWQCPSSRHLRIPRPSPGPICGHPNCSWAQLWWDYKHTNRCFSPGVSKLFPKRDLVRWKCFGSKIQPKILETIFV